MSPIIIIGGIVILLIAFFVYAIITAEPYPEEWEEQEDKELTKKFDEYKKSRD